ncbi:MAG: YkgJ family cysteine cluster protein [Candidatus Aenigmarchaeota archaeon]|nr:YkgJ family cysteine cluster protein [Candidatus Aenigmarchaeota archaeon]
MKIEIYHEEPIEYWCGPDCGDCCVNYVPTFPAEIEDISRRIREPITRFAGLFDSICEHKFLLYNRTGTIGSGTHCVFYDSGCEIHEFKPITCASYPIFINVKLTEDGLFAEVSGESDQPCKTNGERHVMTDETLLEMIKIGARHNAVMAKITSYQFRDSNRYANECYELFLSLELEEAVRILMESGIDEFDL